MSIKLRKDASHRKNVKIKVVPKYWFSIHLYIEPDLQGHTTVNSQVHTDSTKLGALFSEGTPKLCLRLVRERERETERERERERQRERENIYILKSLFIPVGLIYYRQ